MKTESVIMHTIIVICSMCHQLIDIKDGKGCSGNSHGLCPGCLQKALADLRVPISPDMEDSIPIPLACSELQQA